MSIKKTLFSLLLLGFCAFSFAQNTGYDITCKIENYTHQKLKLGFHYGNKQYIKDSATVNADGTFTFKNTAELAPGIYLILLQPKNAYFEVLINKGEQQFSFVTDNNDLVGKMKFKNSAENEMYYNYLNHLTRNRTEANNLRAEMDKDTTKRVKIKEKLLAIDKEIDDYQRNLVAKYPESFTALIIRASKDVDLPVFTGKDDDDIKNQRYWWYKKHFFDNYRMGDDRMIRTPLLHSRVDYYINKLTVQHHDTLIQEVDRVLQLLKPAPDAFKYFLTQFLNAYAKSDIIGQDALYVHLALNYYATGQVTWADKDQIEKIVSNARSVEPTLLGKVAPEFTLTKRDGSKIRLADIKTPYTVVVFWAPDCGHCQKEMPSLIAFWEKWKPKGVEVISICNRTTPDKAEECWKFVEERPGMKFTTGVDMHLQSNTQANYWVKTTPMIYILDKDKKILMKKIQPEKIDEIMDEVIKVEQAKADAAAKKG